MKRENLTRLPERNLDVLRAIAVSCVVVDHVMMVSIGGAWRVLSWSLGMFGVYCFFVHTSLVLMSSLERQSGSVGTFYVRRLFRIVPLVWAVLALVVLFHIPEFPLGHDWTVERYVVPNLRELAGNLAVSQNLIGVRDLLGPLWSLPLEMQMYAVLPIAFAMARRSLYGVIASLLASAVIASWYWQGGGANLPGFWRLSILEYVPCFASGVLAYALLRRYSPRVSAHALPVVLVIAFGVFVGLTRGKFAAWGWPACLFIGLALSAVRDCAESRVTRTAHVICTYSFGVYLLHVPALWVSFVLMQSAPTVLQLGTFVVLLVGLPYLAYRYVERPGIVLGQRLLGWQPLTRAATAPAP